MRRSSTLLSLGSLLVGLSLAGPVSGDWLITAGGERLETRGSWEKRGRMVVFTRPDGTLASIRASLLDLEASRQLSDQPAAVVPEVSEPAVSEPAAGVLQEPIAVLTDENLLDFGDLRVGGTFSAASSAGLDQETQAAQKDRSEPTADRRPAPEGLSVDDWRYVENTSGTEIIGTVHNDGQEIYASIEVIVLVYGVDGELMTTRNARLANPILPPGHQSEFRLLLSHTFGVDRAEFNLTGVPFDARQPEGTEPSDSSTATPTTPSGAGL